MEELYKCTYVDMLCTPFCTTHLPNQGTFSKTIYTITTASFHETHSYSFIFLPHTTHLPSLQPITTPKP